MTVAVAGRWALVALATGIAAAGACGCRAWGFTEPPGGTRVDALAGCTWVQTRDDGVVESWTYDDRGRLVGASADAPFPYRMVATWRGDCLTELRLLDLDTDEPVRVSASDANAEFTTCDRRGNPVWRDEVVVKPNGDSWVIASRSFENSYGGDWLVRVDRWTEPGPGAERVLIDTTEYGWVDVRQPLFVRQTQLSGASLTTEYWWDHHLLRGLSISTGGTSLDLTRTFEDRRLVSEVVSQGEEEVQTIDWSFAEDARFPEGRQTSGAEFVQHDIVVDCR